MILIGMTGKAGAGKDTLADYLVQNLGFTKISFAGPLKAMLAAAGMPEPADRAAKELPVPGFTFTWREAAQKLGTEFGRALDADIWTKVVEQRIIRDRELPQHVSRIVLSDVRFENEATMIRRLGGKVVHVIGRAAELGANAGHASEAGVYAQPDDRIIDNSGNLLTAKTQLVATLWGAL